MDREMLEKIEHDTDTRVVAQDDSKPFYEDRKIKPDPKAIANLASLPRPLAPPGRVPREPCLEEKIETALK